MTKIVWCRDLEGISFFGGQLFPLLNVSTSFFASNRETHSKSYRDKKERADYQARLRERKHLCVLFFLLSQCIQIPKFFSQKLVPSKVFCMSAKIPSLYLVLG